MAVHNGMTWLPEQMASIQAQEAVDVCLCIHDDCSADGSRQWIQQHVPNAVLLPPCERFGAAAQSFFHLLREADLSQVDYVSLADQDDIWLPKKLSRAVAALKQGIADAYSSNVEAFWPDGRTALVNKAQPQRELDYLFEAAGPGCSYVLSVEVARDFQQWLRAHTGVTAEIRFHDWLLYAWVRARGLQWFIDPVVSLRYRQHGGNEVGVNRGARAALRRFRRVLGGFALDQVWAVARCLGSREQDCVARLLADGRRGYLRLALQAAKYRRRPLDQCALGLLALLLAVRGSRRPSPG